jgi:hypothetical protein
VLASEGVMPEDMIKLAADIVISDVVHLNAQCPAGMNVLHHIALQPALLLTKDRNTMRKLMELMIKTGAEINTQVMHQNHMDMVFTNTKGSAFMH